MNVVPLIWQVPDFQMCFSFSILQKLKQLNKTVTKINLPIPSQNTSWRPTCKVSWLTAPCWIEKNWWKENDNAQSEFYFVTMASSTHPRVPTFTFLFSFILSISRSVIHAAWSLFAHNSRSLFWKDNNWHHYLWKEMKDVCNYGRKLIPTCLFPYAQIKNRVV